ncbi:MAG: AmmeMemoRadiSam system protein B, partial [Armatimonadetes bacterium]|nr:AmmeMemoRadiSam system protein B [Armatimonadota bacterium]
MDNRPGTIRKAAVSGTFYPSELCHLRDMVIGFLGEAEGGLVPGELIALMTPHAGYIYSGKTAGWAYRQLENRAYDSIILLGPSHFAPVNGIAVATEEAYETPLGVVSI